MPSPAPDLELRSQWVAYAIRNGATRDEAEDLASEAWIRTSRAAADRAPEEIAAYGYRALKSLMTDRWSSPGRVLAKRVNLVLARPKGKDPIVSWRHHEAVVVGLASQANLVAATLGEVEGIQRRLGDFLYSTTGLAGANPADLSTWQVLERFFIWYGRPMERTALIALLSAVLVVPTPTLTLGPEHEPTVDPIEPSGSLREAWDRIVGLPTFRMRAAVLLAMDEPLLESLRSDPRAGLDEALPEWPPPPPLSEIDLPADDGLVAERLGMTRNSLQVTRNRAKTILQSTLAPLLERLTEPTAQGVG